MDASESFKSYIKSRTELDEDSLMKVLSCFSSKMIKGESIFLRPGQYSRDYHFIVSGAIRVYFKNDDREITGWIAIENNFVTDLMSLRSGKPSNFYFETIEDTVVMSIDSNMMEKLYNEYPAWQAFGRNLWEEAFVAMLESIMNYQTMTADERYLHLMKHTDLLNRIPLKYLSSYLGITQTSLSRLRKKLR
jgi:CRP-like cAMP-binding protein